MMDTESATTVLLWFQGKGPAAGHNVQFEIDTAKSGRRLFLADRPESTEGALAREWATLSVLVRVRERLAAFLVRFDEEAGDEPPAGETAARAVLFAEIASVEAAIQASSRVLVAAVQGRCSGFPIQ